VNYKKVPYDKMQCLIAEMTHRPQDFHPKPKDVIYDHYSREVAAYWLGNIATCPISFLSSPRQQGHLEVWRPTWVAPDTWTFQTAKKNNAMEQLKV
jgi:hypothetical protein